MKILPSKWGGGDGGWEGVMEFSEKVGLPKMGGLFLKWGWGGGGLRLSTNYDLFFKTYILRRHPFLIKHRRNLTTPIGLKYM